MARAGYEAWKRDRPELIAFDTETTGVQFYDEPFCVTVAWENECHYFEVNGSDSYASLGRIQEILGDTPTLVGHNVKFDFQKCILAGLIRREDLHWECIHDTQLIAHLLDEHRSKALKDLARTVLNETTDEDEAIKAEKKRIKKEQGFKSESDIGYHLIPRKVIVPYALKDAEFTLRLYGILRRQLLEQDWALRGLYDQELELLLVLLDMEKASMKVDVPYVEAKVKEYGNRILSREFTIEDIVGVPIGKKPAKGEFNPNSSDQIVTWLNGHTKAKLKSAGKAQLQKVDHPLAAAILDLRSLRKMHGTYLLPILDEQRGGFIHPNFRQNVRTGRMASGGATE